MANAEPLQKQLKTSPAQMRALKTYRQKHFDRIKAYMDIYYKEHQNEISQQKKEYYQRVKDKKKMKTV